MSADWEDGTAARRRIRGTRYTHVIRRRTVPLRTAHIDTHLNDVPQRIDLIGEGTYSTVYRARDHMTGDIVTMKVMKLFPNDEADGVPAHALREVSLLRYLRHPNIVR